MSNKYKHLLSPIKIGNIVLKNRMLYSNGSLHFMQGPENFPTEATLSYFSTIAKNGAAVVTCPHRRYVANRKEIKGQFEDAKHGAMWDIEDPGVQNYYSALTDQIHFYDSKASVALSQLGIEPDGYNISEITEAGPETYMKFMIRPGKEIPVELMQEMIDKVVKRAKLYKNLGFDMGTIYMSYRSSILANSLSPVLNKRTDQYGGSIENRARFAHELFKAIKKACGPDFLVEAQVSGEEWAGGYTIDDLVKYVKIWEDAVDIVQIRAADASLSHPVGFNSIKRHPITLQYAQAIKESGANVVTAPIGGYQDLDLNEEYIASGKTDMVSMVRAFICDPEYGKKAYEGRGDDVVPCVRCNKCHGTNLTGPWLNVCSVNPTAGIAHKVERMIEPVGISKKVAVIGGGPAGMKAAIVAAERGHKVTLYEKTYFLGGQLRHSDFSTFKWPVREFKDYLIRQLDKHGVEVHLSTEATTHMIKNQGFDVVMVAAGADPIIPDIPGATGKNVWAATDVYGVENKLGKNIVVIGGAEIGMETAMYLAENGHDITLLTRGTEDDLGRGVAPIHFIEMFRDAWNAMKNLK